MSDSPRSPAKELKERPLRRPARMSCVLRVGTQDVVGHTLNMSAFGMQVRLAAVQLLPRLPPAGTRMAFRLLLPDLVGRPLMGQCEFMWAREDDHDASGRPARSVGVRLVELSHQEQSRLDAFLHDCLHTVIVASAPCEVRAQLLAALEPQHRVLVAPTTQRAIELLASREATVLLCGESLEDSSGRAFLRDQCATLRNFPAVRIICSSRPFDREFDDLVNLGHAFLCLKTPWRPTEFSQVMHRATDAYLVAEDSARLQVELERAHERLTRENVYLLHRLEVFEGFEQIIGGSEHLRRALAELQQIRKTDTTVHVQGETGTGKELVARALHCGGPRSKAPFVAQNCAGLPQTLLHSTLFGHKKGAFTGANHDHPGIFEQANGGTLFLDEIAELPLDVQPALLRALQQREVTPLGATGPVKVDVRIISATHKDLRDEVARGAFREDLYFRLVVLHVQLPPLRGRKGDIRQLATHFLGLVAQRTGRPLRVFAPEVLWALERYGWPGNVRELKNEVERLAVLADDDTPIPASLLSAHIVEAAEARAPQAAPSADGSMLIPRGLPYDAAVSALEKALIEHALVRSGGNLTRAAALLKMERSRLSKLRSRLKAGAGEVSSE